MKNIDGFFKMISADLKKGTMREVYSSDELTILSVADSFYIASDYTVSEEGYVAFLVNSKMVRAMLVDSSFLERLLTTSDRETLSQMMFRLTDKTFRSFASKKKRKASYELTHKFVDPELEQWIFETFGRPPVRYADEPERMGLTKSIKGLFKK